MIHMEVTLKNGTKGLPVVDVEAELFKDINDPVFVSYIVSEWATGSQITNASANSQMSDVISRKGMKGEYTTMIKSGQINLCDFLKKPDRDPFLKVLMETLSKYGKMINHCPVKRGHFYLKDFIMDSNNLPAFTPLGDYRVDYSVTIKTKTDSIVLYRMSWYATVIEEKQNM